MWQNIVVICLVALAAAYIVRRYLRAKRSPCGTACYDAGRCCDRQTDVSANASADGSADAPRQCPHGSDCVGRRKL